MLKKRYNVLNNNESNTGPVDKVTDIMNDIGGSLDKLLKEYDALLGESNKHKSFDKVPSSGEYIGDKKAVFNTIMNEKTINSSNEKEINRFGARSISKLKRIFFNKEKSSSNIEGKNNTNNSEKRSRTTEKLQKSFSKIENDREQNIKSQKIENKATKMPNKTSGLFSKTDKKLDHFTNKDNKKGTTHIIDDEIKYVNKKISSLLKKFNNVQKKYKLMYNQIAKKDPSIHYDDNCITRLTFDQKNAKDLGLYEYITKLDTNIIQLKDEMYVQLDKIDTIHSIALKSYIPQETSLQLTTNALENIHKDVKVILENISKDLLKYPNEQQENSEKHYWTKKISKEKQSKNTETNKAFNAR